MKKALYLAVLTAALLGSGCGKKPAEQPPKPCHENEDCPGKLVCLAERCADPSAAAPFVDPGNAVTPGKVKRDVELKLEQHEQQNDRRIGEGEN